MHHDACPLCSSADLGLKYSCADHFVSGEKFSLYECSVCGFILTQDSPEQNEIGRYYESEDYISHSNINKGLSNKLYHIARNFMLEKKRAAVKKATGIQTGSLLDIGSGTGHFAGLMSRSGWKATGIEINEKARSASRTDFNLNVIDPSEISGLQSGSFDCITLWHVLEHLENGAGYMQEILRLMKPGGCCIVALPNSMSGDALHYREFWAAWDVPRHLWHFNPDTFRAFSQKAGFIITAIKRLPLDAFYISMLSEKYKGSKLCLVTGLIKGLWFAVSSFIDRRKCSSLIYIIKKA